MWRQLVTSKKTRHFNIVRGCHEVCAAVLPKGGVTSELDSQRILHFTSPVRMAGAFAEFRIGAFEDCREVVERQRCSGALERWAQFLKFGLPGPFAKPIRRSLQPIPASTEYFREVAWPRAPWT